MGTLQPQNSAVFRKEYVDIILNKFRLNLFLKKLSTNCVDWCLLIAGEKGYTKKNMLGSLLRLGNNNGRNNK